ncbi:polysaccharide biosynthesis/export family protein [Sulfitobacter pontiacus]|uniref:polysaccharide biosynthesis/export family protein n=1 Tax=Sulfitobacter pontiacus TaxID=60137 RepID=UPI003297A918
MFRSILTALIGALALCATFMAGTATAQDYLIRSGDTLRIEVLEDPSLNRSVLVAPDGNFTMPLAGGVRAGGQTIASVQRAVAAQLTPNFASAPNVYVALERRRASTGTFVAPTVTVFVVGEAGNPGKMEVEPGTTVLQAFGLMGGFSKFAAIKRIQLHRDGKIHKLNYKAIEQGTESGATVLADGDVLVVPQRKLFE